MKPNLCCKSGTNPVGFNHQWALSKVGIRGFLSKLFVFNMNIMHIILSLHILPPLTIRGIKKSPKPLRPRHTTSVNHTVIHSYIQATFKHVNPTINTFIIKLEWIWTLGQVRTRPNKTTSKVMSSVSPTYPAMCWQCQVRRI